MDSIYTTDPTPLTTHITYQSGLDEIRRETWWLMAVIWPRKPLASTADSDSSFASVSTEQQGGQTSIKLHTAKGEIRNNCRDIIIGTLLFQGQNRFRENVRHILKYHNSDFSIVKIFSNGNKKECFCEYYCQVLK